MNYNITTVEEQYAELKKFKSEYSEPKEVTDKLNDLAQNVCKVARSGKAIKIITDYDADGICAGYIMEKILRSINPNKDLSIEIICNDRRNEYGVPKDLKAEDNTAYIVLDMGSNELDYIRNTFGQDTIIIDHHIINDLDVINEFISNSNLLNAKAFKCSDGESADYCTTGLVYRLYQVLGMQNELIKKYVQMRDDEGNIMYGDDNKPLTVCKNDNNVAIVACLGTLGDVVNRMDKHSLNYSIITDGIEKINNADPNNIDFTLGYLLAQGGMDDKDCVLKQITFGVVPLLNGAGRMSPIIQKNGAQLVMDALLGKDNPETYAAIDNLVKINTKRKSLTNSFLDDNYKAFIFDERSKNIDSNICVYLLPDDTPASFCGLVAGRICNTVDKASLCFTYNSEKDIWSGSGRNIKGQTNFNDYLRTVLSKPEAKNIKMEFGGHENAIGISSLNDVMGLIKVIYTYSDLMEEKAPVETVMKVDVARIGTAKKVVDENYINMINELDIAGLLDKYPCYFDGKEESRYKNFSGNAKTVRVNLGEKKVAVKDWFYSDFAYPQSDNERIAVLCKMNMKAYHDVQFEAVFDRTFLKERQAELQKITAKTQIKE